MQHPASEASAAFVETAVSVESSATEETAAKTETEASEAYAVFQGTVASGRGKKAADRGAKSLPALLVESNIWANEVVLGRKES